MDAVTIRIRRDEFIEESSKIALVKLNTMEHSVGTPIMINYYEGEDTIGTLTAIGIKNGSGKDCYSIVSISSDEIVNGVIEDMVDVVEVVNGEVYIIYYNNKWCKATIANEDFKDITPLDANKKQSFFDISEKIRWFWDGESVYKEYDFFTKEEIRGMLNDLPVFINVKVTLDQGALQEKGTNVVNPKLNINITDFNGNTKSLFGYDVDITSDFGTERILNKENNFVELERTISDNTTYSIKLTDKVTNKTLTELCVIEFVSPVYYGVFNDYNYIRPREDGVTTKKILWDGKSNLDLDFTYTRGNVNNIVNKITAFIIPFELYTGEPKQILDRNGLDYSEDYISNTVTFSNFGNKKYQQFEKKDYFSMDGSFKQILIYE